MADIKTRDAVKGTIKTIDKAAVAGQRMKQAYISTKDKAEHSTSAAENSADEYAADMRISKSKLIRLFIHRKNTREVVCTNATVIL